MNKNLKHLNAVVTKATTSPNNNLPDPIKQKNIGSMLSKLNGVDIDSAQKSKNIGTEYNEDFIDEDWLSYTDSSINLDELRAQRQSNFSKTMSGLGRVGAKVAAEVAKMPGMVGGLIASPFSKAPAVETIFNNAWINSIEDANEYVNNEYLPVYIKDSVKNGNIIDNLTSIDFWATEGADGVGYIASMFVPGAVLKGLGAGKVAMKGLSKASKGMFKTADSAQDALKAIGATENNLNAFNATIANTFFEAGAEAGGAMDAYEQGQLQKLQSGEITQEQFDKNLETKADIGRNIFWSNVGILVGPNMITNKILYGAKKGKLGIDAFKDEAGKFSINSVKKGVKKKTLDYTGEFAKGFVREGFWEEAMQSSVEHMFLENANGNDIGLFDSYIHTLTSVEGQKAIALGGLLGGPMNVYGKYSQDKATDAKRKAIAPHMENMIELFTMSPSQIFDVDQETGKRTIKPKYAIKYGEEIKKVEEIESFYDKIQAYKEKNGGKLPANIKAVADARENKFISAMILPFITEGEQGIQILKKALEANEDIQKKVDETNEILDIKETKGERVAKIVKQAEQMQDDYSKSSEYLKFFTPVNRKGANQQDLDSFYNQMNMLETVTKQNKRFLEENKIKIEQEVSNIEFESLKKFQNKTTISKNKYNKIFKGLRGTNKKQFTDYQQENDGFNSQESFLEWYKNQNDGVIYKNKIEEIESISNALSQQYDILETLYDKKELQKAFDYKVSKENQQQEELKEKEAEAAKQEAEAKENIEEEIITEDNKAKKVEENKQTAAKKKKVFKEINDNNKAYDYFMSIFKSSSINTQTEPIDSVMVSILNNLNLDLNGIENDNIITYRKNDDNSIEVEIMNSGYKSIDKAVIEKREIKEETPTVNKEEDTVDNTTNDNLDEGSSETNKDISNSINNEPQVKNLDGSILHSKLVDSKDNEFADEAFFAYSETPRDKKGEEVTFKLGVPGNNTKAQEALDMMNNQSNDAVADIEKRRQEELKNSKKRIISNTPINEYDNIDLSGYVQIGMTLTEEQKNQGLADDIELFVENNNHQTVEDYEEYKKTQGHTYWNYSYINNRKALKQGVNLYSKLKKNKDKINAKYDSELEEAKFLNRSDTKQNLTDQQKEFLYDYLPIKVNVKNGGFSHLFFKGYNVALPSSQKAIRKNIIDKMLKGETPKSKIMFQKPGMIQLDRTSDGSFATNKVFDTDGNSNLVGGKNIAETTIMFSNATGYLVDYNNKNVGNFGTVKNAGQIFIEIPMANGTVIPLKLNQRRINSIEAEILFKIVKSMIDPSIKLSYKDNLEKLKESVTFTQNELDYIETEVKALGKKVKTISVSGIMNNFVFKGNTDVNTFEVDGSYLRMADKAIASDNMDASKEEIIEWLTTEKNRQITKKAVALKSYKKHLFNTVLTTDAVLGKPLFSEKTSLYIDPNLGEDPLLVQIERAEKKITERKEKSPKSTLQDIKDKKKSEVIKDQINNSSTKEEDVNSMTDEEAMFLGLVEETRSEDNTVKKESVNDTKETEPESLEEKVKLNVDLSNTSSVGLAAALLAKLNENKPKDNPSKEEC